jgi:dTDP-glucose 4,6-dehydratase
VSKMLVTGGAGFIGSAFVRRQLTRYADLHIVTLDKLTYSGNLDNLRQVDTRRHTFVHGDVADPDAVAEAMRGCGLVVHFAAESHVDRSLVGAADFIATNIAGVNTLLEQAVKNRVDRVLLVSTDEVYGSIETGSFTEEAPVHPRNPYAASMSSCTSVQLVSQRQGACWSSNFSLWRSSKARKLKFELQRALNFKVTMSNPACGRQLHVFARTYVFARR